MTSTTDVLMSFLGDLESGDFFFPELDNENVMEDFHSTDNLLSQSQTPFSKYNNFPSPSLTRDISTGSVCSWKDSPNSSDYISSDCGTNFETAYSPTDFSSSPFHSVMSNCIDLSGENVYVTNDTSSLNAIPQVKKVARIRKKKDAMKIKKKKLSAEEKMTTLVSILKNMRKTVQPATIPESKEILPSKSTAIDHEKKLPNFYLLAEGILVTVLSGTGCRPEDLMNTIEPTGTFYIPVLTSLFSLAHTIRSKSNLSAWVPVHESVDVFPERHCGVGQIAAASRCFSRTLSDIASDKIFRGGKISVNVKKSSVSFGNQLIAPFVWKCVHEDKSYQDVEFKGMIRCTFGESKISFAHVSFDAFTIIRQCKMA